MLRALRFGTESSQKANVRAPQIATMARTISQNRIQKRPEPRRPRTQAAAISSATTFLSRPRRQFRAEFIEFRVHRSAN